MDSQSDARLHAAAQEEASSLVWQHQNGGLETGDRRSSNKFKEHLRKGSYDQFRERAGQGHNAQSGHRASLPRQWEVPQRKSYMGLASLSQRIQSRKSSGTKSRNSSAGTAPGPFRNPEDQIYEEDDDRSQEAVLAAGQPTIVAGPLRDRTQNPIGKARENSDDKYRELPPIPTQAKLALSDFEGDSGALLSKGPSNGTASSMTELATDALDCAPRMKNGMEVRSEEIRNATSMKLKDRSPKLPSPSFVSHSPGRPIVSFDPKWQPKETESDQKPRKDRAAGERFHPECFICYHCGEGLECVAFYPEPESKRAERIEQGEQLLQDPDGAKREDAQAIVADGDPSLRFYCHLDYHELFSPRCRSCKTPIEGEVVVACGAEWHVGHFFCAQCGDPFDSAIPFVEKDGYAWCVNCHTNRFSTKCKRCRKPVTDMVVYEPLLSWKWH
ncbi:MAG: hypothetical protein M1826_000914 [Phylliscum demangeonii]|nr:MAG: hypothetical protein M1826_000914 [Phylliscum demangeonii]